MEENINILQEFARILARLNSGNWRYFANLIFYHNILNHRIIVTSFVNKGSHTGQAIRRGEWLFLCLSVS